MKEKIKGMKREEILTQIKQSGVIAVIRGANADEGIKSSRACIEGGIKVIEVTYTMPGAGEVIAALNREFGESVLVGAGTVLDPQTARSAMLAGAKFIVAPSLNPETIRLCNRYCVLCIPGIGSATELQQALELGAGLVKLFPGDVFKPAGLKAFKGPFPQADIMPTGGVSADNAEEWFKAGAAAVGAGSFLTAGAKKGDYEEVKRTARAFADKVARIKGGAR